MESGTLLHLALLRKTSNAKHRKKYHRVQKDFPQENLPLTGWSVEDPDFKDQHQKQNYELEFEEEMEDMFETNSYRKPMKSALRENKSKYRSYSFRTHSHKKTQELAQIFPKQAEVRKTFTQPKFSKVEISYTQKPLYLKENTTVVMPKKSRKRQALSFTKFVSDINIQNKKIFRRF